MNELNQSLYVLEKLAALVATPGVDEKTQSIANEHMQALLNGPIKTGLTKMSLETRGVII